MALSQGRYSAVIVISIVKLPKGNGATSFQGVLALTPSVIIMNFLQID
ncbi:hypothetical protein [Sulfuracidifex tepidarius]|nr:hypothetical protein [Sulfuracidifex tepidarius]